MPNIKSAIKRVKVIAKKTAANKIKKSEIRTAVKKTKAAVASSVEGAADMIQSTQATLDKAAAMFGFTTNLFILRLLLGESRCTLSFEIREITAICGECSKTDMQDAVDDRIEKVSIV